MSLFSSILDILFPRERTEAEILSLSAGDLAHHLKQREVDGVHVLFSYNNAVIKKMVWMLKYNGDRHVAKLFATVLVDTFLEDIADASVFDGATLYTIIPLPLSVKRNRERGFNQMELVGAMFAALCSIPIETTVLVKSRHTPPQTSLTRQERLRNISGAFEVRGEIRRDTIYLLIDDVLTTGSTLAEAKKTLTTAGARKVICVALAH